MKIITKNITENHSLNVAKSFAKEIELEFSEEFNETDELVLYVPNLENSLFSAECFNDLYGVYQYFTTMYRNVIIIPENHIDFYKYPEPTIIYFAGGKLWKTNSRMPQNPILFGKENQIKDIVEGKELKYNNGIFYGGETTLISPIPSIIANLDEEQLPTVSCAMFNLESYKEMLNQIPTNEQKELMNEEN